VALCAAPLARIPEVDQRGQLERVARSLGIERGVFASLAEVQSADLRAVLRPSPLGPAVLRAFETRAMDALPSGFVELTLGPHAPLGTSSVLAGFSQDRVLTTAGDSEVVSDSTNVLALECALRRRAATHVARATRASRRLIACCGRERRPISR
jgi:hypothetical protein